MPVTPQKDPICTVLLVDDEPFLLGAFKRSLRHQPYEILVASSGEEAVQIINSREIDVVVSDEKMAGMSGSELLAWIGQAFPDIVCILLTGDSSVRCAQSKDGKVFRVLSKPCKLTELNITIGEGLDARQNHRSPNSASRA